MVIMVLMRRTKIMHKNITETLDKIVPEGLQPTLSSSLLETDRATYVYRDRNTTFELKIIELSKMEKTE